MKMYNNTENIWIIVLFLAVFLLIGRPLAKKLERKYRRKQRQVRRTVSSPQSYRRTKFDYLEEKSAEEKGEEGERFVAASALSKLPPELFLVFNDMILTTADGNTTQVDHVVIGSHGIFVIETKNYQGKVYGNESSSEWHQYLGQKEFPFHNPIHQNYGHVKTLASTLQLPESVFVPIVVFPNPTTLRIEAHSSVLHVNELADYICNYSSKCNFTTEQMNKYFSVLCDAQEFNRGKKLEHIEYVQKIKREKDAKIEAGICPKCGGNLVLKNGKHGSFYGCSNYPKCRYIVRK